jgi:hypothetical protein
MRGDAAGVPPRAGAGPDSGHSAAADGGATCQIAVEDLVVTGADRAGYPPYAASDCALLYIASDGALRLRPSGSGSESVIAEAAEQPARPSLAGPTDDPARVIAWESLRDRVVRVRFDGTIRDVLGSYHHSGQPRATYDAVVLTAYRAADPQSDADVLLYEPASQALTAVGTGSGQQLFADVSATQVVYSDFAEDPDQSFDDDGRDLADLVIVDRKTLARLSLELEGKQAFPLFSDAGQVVYLSWALSHPEPKLSAYSIMHWDPSLGTRAMLANVETQPPYVRPSVYGSTVEWVERPYGQDERLLRAQLQGNPPSVAFTQAGTQLYATASNRNATFMAVQTGTQSTPVLLAIPR